MCSLLLQQTGEKNTGSREAGAVVLTKLETASILEAQLSDGKASHSYLPNIQRLLVLRVVELLDTHD